MGDVSLLSLGAGNILSIKRGLERNGLRVRIISQPEEIKSSKGIVIPGVGNFGYFAQYLQRFQEPIHLAIDDGVAILGICLGMQLFFEGSDEGSGEGLGLFNGRCVRFNEHLKIPHMGWNTVSILQEREIMTGIDDNSDFYFVHSYSKHFEGTSDEVGLTNYGVDFVSIIQKGNLVGVQFHPEKSGLAGQRFLQNYANLLRR